MSIDKSLIKRKRIVQEKYILDLIKDLVEIADKHKVALKESEHKPFIIPDGIDVDISHDNSLASGISSIGLGLTSYYSGNHPDAEQHFNHALTVLEQDHAHLINVLGLYGMMASALVSQDSPSKNTLAAKEAEKVMWSQSPGPGSWLELGRVFYLLRNYSAAINALKKEMAYNDANPLIYYHIGASYICLAMDRIEADSDKMLDEAIDYLDKAIRLCDKDDKNNVRYKSHFWLGRSYHQKGDLDEALYHYKIANHYFTDSLVSELFIGYSYYEKNEMLESLRVLNRLAEKASSLYNSEGSEDKLNVKFGEDLGFTMSLGEIIARSNSYMAYIYIDQDINEKKVKNLTLKIEKIVKALEKSKDNGSPPNMLQYCQADLHLCKGWLDYKDSLNGGIRYVLNKDKIEKIHDRGFIRDEFVYDLDDLIKSAIMEYEHSIALAPDDRAYYLLALAYESLFHVSKKDNPIFNMACKAKIQACCQTAKKLDRTKHYELRINDLLSRIS